MADERSVGKLVSKQLKKRIDLLEKRAAFLEKEYANLQARTRMLDDWTNSYGLSIEREKKTARIIELLMKVDTRSRLLLDYTSIYFQIILIKSQEEGAEISTIKDLWNKIGSDDAMDKTFLGIVQKLGFSKDEQEVLRMILEVVHQRSFSLTLQSQPFADQLLMMHGGKPDDDELGDDECIGDSDVASLFIYLQSQDDFHRTIRTTFRRIVAVAHCGLCGSADQEGGNPDCIVTQEAVHEFLTYSPTKMASPRGNPPTGKTVLSELSEKLIAMSDGGATITHSVENSPREYKIDVGVLFNDSNHTVVT